MLNMQIQIMLDPLANQVKELETIVNSSTPQKMTKKMLHRSTSTYHSAAPALAKSANKKEETANLHLTAKPKGMNSRKEYSMARNHQAYSILVQPPHSLHPRI
jgi:predicted RNase H-like nuclease